MVGEPTITIIGNMVADAELRFTASGVPVANFTVAATPRTFDKQRNEWVDGEALFMRCVAWKQLAENTAESLVKGVQVIVQGRLRARSYETKDGDRRTTTELEVDAAGPSLQFVTATVNRAGARPPAGGGFAGPAAAAPSEFGDNTGFGGFTADGEPPF